MNVIIRLVLIVGVLAIQACSSIQPRGHVGYGYAQPQRTVYPAHIDPKSGQWVVSSSAPMNAYAYNSGAASGAAVAFQESDGRWNIAGFVQSNPPRIVGSSDTSSSHGGASVARGGMAPDTAKARLTVLDAMSPNPCSAESNTRTTLTGSAVGAVIGGALGAVLDRNLGSGLAKGAVIGGALGAGVGHGDAVMSCEAWTAERSRMQAIIDTAKPQCREGLSQREVNGQLSTVKTRDCGATEVKDFARISDTPPASAAPARPAPTYRPAPPRSRPVEELPPK